MSRTRPYIAAGCDQQGRVKQTRLLAWEDAAGTCNTCPGELEPAEALPREPVHPVPAYPWRDLGAGLAVCVAAVAGAHVVASLWPVVLTVAAR